jgi:hypothetical protein
MRLALIAAVLLGCSSEDYFPDAIPRADEDGAVVAEDAGAVVDAADDVETRDAGDEGEPDAAVDPGDGDGDGDVSGDGDGDGDARDAGPVPEQDAGVEPPVVDVAWEHRVETRPPVLGGVTLHDTHRPRLLMSFYLGDSAGTYCHINATTEWLPRGFTGVAQIPLSEAEVGCLRDTRASCTPDQLHVEWLSCDEPGCSSQSTGPVWETWPPVCVADMPDGPIEMRVVIEQLNPDALIETWQIVRP